MITPKAQVGGLNYASKIITSFFFFDFNFISLFHWFQSLTIFKNIQILELRNQKKNRSAVDMDKELS